MSRVPETFDARQAEVMATRGGDGVVEDIQTYDAPELILGQRKGHAPDRGTIVLRYNMQQLSGFLFHITM